VQTLNLKIAGLYTNPNQFSEIPPGALYRANDVVIDRDSVAASRRGQALYATLGEAPEKLFYYSEYLLALYGSTLSYDFDGSGTFTDYSGTFDPPGSGIKIKSLESNQNFYLATVEGVKKLDSPTGTWQSSGGIKALYGTATTQSPGFMSNNVQVAYRMVWGYRDANDNEIIGAPSQRLVVTNSSGVTVDVVTTWNIPAEITTSYFYRIYRSGESAGVSYEPDDEVQKVKEDFVTAAEITAGTFSFTDNVPDALRGAYLYTNPSQEGILQSNEPPPYCQDMTLFRDSSFYFNTRSKHRYSITLVSVGDNSTGGQFGYQTNDGDIVNTSTTVDALTKKAQVVIQDLTYDADTTGVGGNDINITYTGGATAGSEVVAVSTNDISCQIEDGVSTATQVKTAIDAVPAAAALVDITVSGVGANAQNIVAQTFLDDGFDTTTLNVGMRVEGTGIPADTYIASITDADTVEITNAATATATNPLEFQDVFRFSAGGAEYSYYGTTANDFANNEFLVALSGTAATNIETTALNLVGAINKDTSQTTLYAYYSSESNELPGKIYLEERSLGGNAFTLTSTNGVSFSPTLDNTGSGNISDNDEKQNRAMISKPNQPEAVPLLQYLTIGSENYPITRGIALRDSIFVFKPGEGIFRITGTTTNNFTVSIFDSSAQIKGAETAAVLNNQIFCFSDQGVIVVSETGVQIISRPIETTLLEISGESYQHFETASFGVAYESDRKYMLFTVTNVEDTYATQAFVFNTVTNTWSRWIMDRTCGILNKLDDKIYMGEPTGTAVYKERKNLNRTDYADREFSITISSSSGTTVNVNSTTNLEAGDLLKQGALEAIISSVDSATALTVDETQSWSAAAATVYEAINPDIEWVENTADNPGVLKHFSECTVFFQNASFKTIDFGFVSSLDENYEYTTMTAPGGSGWGQFPWGENPWSIAGGRAVPLRTYVPLEKSRSSWLKFRVKNREAYSSFSVSGISAQFDQMSERFR